MSLYLYGVIEQGESIDLGPIGFGGGSVRAISRGDLAAIVGHPPVGGDLTQSPKETLVRHLLSHQQTLESVMKRFFVLPFKFGTTVRDEPDLMRILEEGESFLSGLLSRLKDFCEMDVIATWEVPKILQEISEEDSEIVTCKSERTHQGTADRAFVGMLLAKALQKRAAKWCSEILEWLKLHAGDSVEHDLLNDEMVMNRSFLVSHEKLKPFFDALSEADLAFKKRLHFKCVGPLPPYSFATITVGHFDPEEVQNAARLLRLNGRTEASEIKRIYKNLSRVCHPDLNPGASPVEFERLTKAYELLASYCADGPRSLEGQAITSALKLSVFRSPEARL